MLEDPIHWRKLVREYSMLAQSPPDISRQSRGQRFNRLIAELFKAFGIAAKADQRSVGEIDVTFSHAGRRFILEAKWEQRPTSTDSIAKLQRRVEQRMMGVTGVFLSMAGYTKPALDEIDKGRRLDLVLLDRQHWEAMLSGFVPPAELLDLVTDRASFDGSAYTSLRALLDQKTSMPALSFGQRKAPSRPVFTPVAEHVQAEEATVDFESTRLGVSADHDGKVLVTAEHGIFSVDLESRAASWEAPVSGCDGAALRFGTAVLVHRAHGVARCEGGAVEIVSTGGAAIEKAQLGQDGRGAVWCFDPGSVGKNHDAPATIIAIGGRLGTESEREVPYRPAAATGATYVSEADLVVAGEPDFVLVPGSGDSQRRWILPISYPVTTVAVDAAHSVSLSRDASLWVTDVRNGRSAVLGRVEGVEILDGQVAKASSSSVHVAVRYRGPGGKSRVSLMCVNADGEWLPPGLLTDAVAGGESAAPAVQETEAVPEAGLGSRQVEEATPPVGSRAESSAPPLSDDARHADHRRGERDAIALAEKLPLHVFEGAVRVSFDVARWLKPLRESWQSIASGQAPPHAVVPDWLPAIARHLGSYAAPGQTLESHFTPTPSYVLGFSAGMREVWVSLVQRGFVPGDVNMLSQWLAQPSGSPARPRGLMTPKDLRAQSYKEKGQASWRWTVRIALWLFTAFFAIGTIVAIILTATDGWPGHSFGNALGGNLFYGVPFVVLLFFTIRDLRKLRRKSGRGPT